MHRWTLCENVDSAKIKVSFYTTDIDILRVASMHRIVIHRIVISMNRYTPIIYIHTHTHIYIYIYIYIHTYSALQKYWNSKDKIALLAVESRHLQV